KWGSCSSKDLDQRPAVCRCFSFLRTKMNLKNFAPTLVATASLLSPAALLAQDLGIDVGATAPVVTVQSLDGKNLSLGNYIGKAPVLIEFWESWWPTCQP